MMGLAVALLGCGKKDSGPGIAIEDAPQQIAQAVCPKAYGCCTPMQLAPNDLAGKDETSCETKTATGFKNNLDGLKNAIAAGRVAYHGDKLATCLAFIRGANCSQLDTTNHFSGLDCDPYLEPLVAPGGVCTGDVECIDGACDKPTMSSGDGVCRARPRQGESCATVGCANGFVCSGDGQTCQPAIAVGGMCTSDGQCATGNCSAFTGTKSCAPPPANQCFYASACSYGRAPLGLGWRIAGLALASLGLRARRRRA
jgi:hypothetical protein